MGFYDVVHRLQRTAETHQRRMAPGDLGGRTESASPAKPITVVSPLPIQQAPAGGIQSHILLNQGLFQPPLAPAGVSTDLEWKAPGLPAGFSHNVGTAFSWSAAVPRNVVVNEDSLVLFALNLNVSDNDFTWIACKLFVPHWGGIEAAWPKPGAGATQVSLTFVYTASAGNTINATAFHDGTNSVSIGDMSLSLTQLVRL